MTSVTARRAVDAPTDRVWALATDVPRWPETISGISRIEMLSEGEFGPGTRWRETRTMFGREATEEMWVSTVDPGRSYTVEADSHGAHYVSTFTFDAVGEQRTEIVLTFTGEPLSPIALGLTSEQGVRCDALPRRNVTGGSGG
ncbi:MAG: SRPBCC family protein [Nocardioidaceae bacterium]